MKKIPVFDWNDITTSNEEIPEGPGIYAWYYIPHKPIDTVKYPFEANVEKVRKSTKADLKKIKNDYKYNDEKKHLFHEPFSPLLPPNYDSGGFSKHLNKSTMYGPKLLSHYLQPEYEATLTRFFDAPAIKIIDAVVNGYHEMIFSEIEHLIPGFFPPIYVGKANNLRKRINSHKITIEKFVNSKISYDAVAKYAAICDAEPDDKSPDEKVLLRAFGSQIAYLIHLGIANKFQLRFVFHEINLVHHNHSDNERAKGKALEAVEGLINKLVSPAKGRR